MTPRRDDGLVWRPQPGVRTAAEGPLAGLTFTVKDLFDVAGAPTGAGCAAPLVEQAPSDAPIVAQLGGAGAALVGKTATVQLAFGGWGTNQVAGFPLNPLDMAIERAPGGSSSGAAVAVASGACDVAIGTDTGGSVRIPASFCGVVGFKPAGHTWFPKGCVTMSETLDRIGWMARDVATAERLWQGELAPSQAIAVAWCGPGAAPLPAWRRIDALVLIEALAPPTADIFLYEGARARDRWPEPLDPFVAERIARGREIDHADYRRALAGRPDARRRLIEVMSGADVLALPTTPMSAPALADIDERSSRPALWTRAFNYLDWPALTLPAPQAGMPVGLQLATQPGKEALLFSLARHLEATFAAGEGT